MFLLTVKSFRNHLRYGLALAAFAGSCLFPALSAPAANDQTTKTVLVLGDSLSAGYGVDPSQAFPTLLQEKIEKARLPYKIVNAGVSGDTSAGGVRRLQWLLRQPVSILLLELGGNDGLRGLALETTRTNLQQIIDQTRKKYPAVKILIAGMQMPPNLGVSYVNQFAELFPGLAKINGAVLIPFLLEDVGGRPNLNQADQIHPNPEGHSIVANNVWKVLKPMLQSETAETRPENGAAYSK
ncbi:MAG: lipolytic protein family [Verrucomicrobiales bacterium]|nr:lipolytic protein family [Verrucomicrobiales bacterium]